MGLVTAVVSGKGGAGKTTVTAALGAQLARMGQKCVLVDADLGLRSLDAVLGLQNHVTYDVMDAALGLCELREALIRDSLHPGLYLLPASRGVGQDRMDRFSLMEVCAQLRRDFDQVLLDAPAGIGEGMQRAAACADRALVVTLPEVTSVRGAAQAAEILKIQEIPAGLIINRYRTISALLGHTMDTDSLSAVLPLPIVAVVPEDGAVMRLQGQCRPVTDSRSPAGKALKRAAAELIGEEESPRADSRFINRRRKTWVPEDQEASSGSPLF